MKGRTILLASVMVTVVATAQSEEARWLRYNAISPDGTQIAFAYKGDIYKVNSNGGDAIRLTTNDAHESNPIWSADGKYIAFSSTREGTADVYVISSEGGQPKRLTTYPGTETPLCFDNNGNVLFSAAIEIGKEYSDLQTGDTQVYSVGINGGRPKKISDIMMSNISINKAGNMLYEDYKGYEDPFRKHHTSSVTRDIWLYTMASGEHKVTKNGKFEKLSTFKGENRNPYFAADGDTYYYISEESGTFNIWKSSISNRAEKKQITKLETNPVRYISVASNGLIAFSYNGDLYTVKDGQEPKKLSIRVSADNAKNDVIKQNLRYGASDIALSPNEKEIAFIAHGDVFVTSIEYGTTKRITNTAEQERNLSITPDGHSIVYSSERNGMWNIYMTSLADKEERYFTYAQELKETQLTHNSEPCFYPQVSPDGKHIAYLKNRTTLCVADIDGKDEKVVLDGKWNYSYSDGDQEYTWSPDSRYIIANYIGIGGWHHIDAILIDIEKGTTTDLTESGYNDVNYKWVMGGKAMAWMSDKYGYRSHGSWGSEDDIFLMFFDEKAYIEFNRTEEEEKLYEELNRDKKKEKKEKKEEEKKEEEQKDGVFKPEKVEELNLDLTGRYERMVRLTNRSAKMGDFYLSKNGRKLFYTQYGEGSQNLYVLDIREGSIRLLSKNVYGNIVPNKDGSAFFVARGSGIDKIETGNGSKKSISYSGDFEYKPAQERSYIFDHAWQQVKNKFYDPSLHGVNWDDMKANYKQFLPYIDNNYDFKDLLSEMLGELNGSHTGARYRPQASHSMGYLGALFDDNYVGDGLKITEIIKRGPLADTDPKIEIGDIITAIDGKEIKNGQDWFEMLTDKVNKKVVLTVKGKKSTIGVRPISGGEYDDLLYKRWVEKNEKLVDKLSGGRVAYVHVKGMNSDSFREVYSKLLGKYRNCESVIVDTRHNGGGWLHDDLATLLSGKSYVDFEPRGQFISTEPHTKWTKPSCVLVSEDNYSDAHGFPYTYQSLKLGKIIGTPVPGTMTAVWWETQIDHTLVFGIPQVGSKGVKDGRYIENLQLEPDILVYNTPESVLAGEDKQLEAAVKEMMK